MKFKRIVAVISAAAVALVLTGCAKNETPLGGNTTQSGKPTANSNKNNSDKPSGAESAPIAQLPDNVWEVIPEIPETEASAFSYAYDESGDVMITDYLGQSKTVRIPYIIEGKPVVKVDLTQCKKKITELVMPDSVKSFKLSAESRETLQYVNVPAGITKIYELFNKMYGNAIGDNCENLISVFIPDSVTELGRYAFAYCESLTSITLPDGLIKIDEGAFSQCKSLENITIPDSVTVIDNGADGVFFGCLDIKVTYKGKTYDYEHIGDLCEAINYGE